ncbi:MAG: PH domain-containing protein [Actinomycetota bacterium]|nr:PH domain-containing protein [Actinomycetota bacterium]
MNTRANDLLDGTEQQLDPKIAIVWAVGSAAPPLFLTIAAVVTILAVDAPEWMLGVALFGGVALTLAGVVWARMAWARWRWTAWPDAVELRHGVLRVHESVVPYHRIQQIDIVRDPLERVLGLSSVILRTASASSDAKIPGLPEATADGLRRRLLTLAGVDDAV